MYNFSRKVILGITESGN